MNSTRVAYVTQWFPPEQVQVPTWIAQALRRQGVQVDVLTGIPNYPAGRAFDGYPAWKRSVEEIDGFRVERTPLVPSHSRSALGRLTNYGSWALSSALLGQRVLSRADVALVYSSPATAALAPLVAKGLWGTPYVTSDSGSLARLGVRHRLLNPTPPATRQRSGLSLTPLSRVTVKPQV